MCFSATASFSAGAALLIVGAVTVRRARRRAELPFSLIPVLFGIQQLIEGAIWLTFPDKAGTSEPPVPATSVPLYKDKGILVPIAVSFIALLFLILLVLALREYLRRQRAA